MDLFDTAMQHGEAIAANGYLLQRVEELESLLGERDAEIATLRERVDRLREIVADHSTCSTCGNTAEVNGKPCDNCVWGCSTIIATLRADKELTTCEKCRHVFPYAHLSVPCPHCIIEDLEGKLADSEAACAGLAGTFDTLRDRAKVIEELEGKLCESKTLIDEALGDDDFQPCFDQRNHMVGPALRGTLERAAAALDTARDEGESD